MFDLLFFMGFVAYNMMDMVVWFCFGVFMVTSPKQIRRFDAIYNFYITLYRSYVGKYIDVSEHVGFLLSVQLCITNMGDTFLDVGAFVFT